MTRDLFTYRGEFFYLCESVVVEGSTTRFQYTLETEDGAILGASHDLKKLRTICDRHLDQSTEGP